MNRCLEIDIAKSIGIYFVVLCHMKLVNTDFWHFVYSFHMPLFFFISGLLYKDRTLKETITINVQRLLIPYATFYCISYIWWIYFVFIRNPSGYYPPISFYACVIKPFLGLITGVLHNTNYSYSTNVALWFILSLLELKILLSVFNKIEKKWLQIFFLGITSYIGYCFQRNNILLFYSFNFTLLNLPYFFAGFYFKTTFYTIINNDTSKYLYILMCLITMTITWFGSAFLIKDENGVSELIFFIMNIIVAFSGIGMILSLSFYAIYIIKDENIIALIRYVSDNTLSIMGLHILFNGILCGFVKNVLNVNTMHVPMFIAIGIACVSMTLSLYFGSVLTKYMPKLIGK